jgi:two-component system, sensor histidine kinase PdtaS
MMASATDAHLRRLVASWGMVADFGFADLLLLVPMRSLGGSGQEASLWKIAAQMRPTTGQTLYPEDLVGTLVSSAERPLVRDAWAAGEHREANVQSLGTAQPARAKAIPVRALGGMEPIALLLKEEALDTGRRRGQLERTYLGIFDQLAAMISSGQFPFAEAHDPRDPPRVGDGVALLDAERRLRYVSPNATSALHRLGMRVNTDGHTLSELGLDDSSVRRAWRDRHPVGGELERGPESVASSPPLGEHHLGTAQLAGLSSLVKEDEVGKTVVVVHCIPLLTAQAGEQDTSRVRVTGAVLLLRDVSDIRRRDRLLLSKDATIREVHHRVKNNLQTISALLRLQGRRLHSTEAKQAVEESVRRIRSIALVHETLSQKLHDTVPFDDLIRPLIRIVEEGLQGDDRPVRFNIIGEAGSLPADVATPLAVVLVELMQNAVEHAYPSRQGGGADSETGGGVDIEFAKRDHELHVTVRDHGVGFPHGFTLSTSRSLGLTIVRTLITTELGGAIATSNDGGAIVELRVPTTAERAVDR